MENRERLTNLYLIYSLLLTSNERNYFEYYYFEDYSLSEIADNNKVSKANVSKVINNATMKLNDYEEKLKIYQNHNEIRKLISNINDKQLVEKIEDLL